MSLHVQICLNGKTWSLKNSFEYNVEGISRYLPKQPRLLESIDAFLPWNLCPSQGCNCPHPSLAFTPAPSEKSRFDFLVPFPVTRQLKYCDNLQSLFPSQSEATLVTDIDGEKAISTEYQTSRGNCNSSVPQTAPMDTGQHHPAKHFSSNAACLS